MHLFQPQLAREATFDFTEELDKALEAGLVLACLQASPGHHVFFQKGRQKSMGYLWKLFVS